MTLSITPRINFGQDYLEAPEPSEAELVSIVVENVINSTFDLTDLVRDLLTNGFVGYAHMDADELDEYLNEISAAEQEYEEVAHG